MHFRSRTQLFVHSSDSRNRRPKNKSLWWISHFFNWNHFLCVNWPGHNEQIPWWSKWTLIIHPEGELYRATFRPALYKTDNGTISLLKFYGQGVKKAQMPLNQWKSWKRKRNRSRRLKGESVQKKLGFPSSTVSTLLKFYVSPLKSNVRAKKVRSC